MRFLIKLILYRLGFLQLKEFAQIIHDGFVAQVADYPAPTVTMVDFQADINALEAAKQKWGTKGNRGSHADYVALVATEAVVRDDLRRLATYAQTTKPDNKLSWTQLGFEVKGPKAPPKQLTMVQNFRLFFGSKIPGGFIKLKWKKPLDTKASEVKGYIIQFNDIPDQPQLKGNRGIVNCWDVISNTSIRFIPPYIGPNYFWITPYNAAGHGVSSDLIQYNAPGPITPEENPS